jgi:hypothetical protein
MDSANPAGGKEPDTCHVRYHHRPRHRRCTIFSTRDGDGDISPAAFAHSFGLRQSFQLRII